MKREKELILRPSSIASTEAVGVLTIKARTNLYEHMYEIAKYHRDSAKRLDGKDMRAEIKESMISILFSYTCLEAYINTVGEDKLGSDWVRFSGKRTTLESKWLGVSRELAATKSGRPHSMFNKKEEPFKSFLELEKIREDYLVHRKAEFGDIVPTKYGSTEGTIKVFDCNRAEWACEVVKQMVRKLNENIANPPSDSWFDS